MVKAGEQGVPAAPTLWSTEGFPCLREPELCGPQQLKFAVWPLLCSRLQASVGNVNPQ